MAATRYNAKDYSIILEDTVTITGLGEDMASGEKDEEFFSASVGAQGSVCISEINNDLGTITITVQTTCPQKKYLLSLAKKTEPFSLWVINKTLGEKFGGNEARLKNYPEMARGAEAEDMEFEFQIFDYTVSVD